ncbi:MAG: DUF1641 domain-containing protein [Verrucomicrobia bacterium]|nr:DUF1641 domain-containing protein [Verrucomicrobiota bacterium]
MAEPILLKIPTYDPRETLFRRLETAPREHAEALLATYEILQSLHDQGVLEVIKGALGSSEKVLQILIDAGNTPEVIRGIRNVIVILKILDGIEPELLEGLARGIPKGIAEAKRARTVGFFKVLARLFNRNTLRVLTVLTSVLDSLGKCLTPRKLGSRPRG